MLFARQKLLLSLLHACGGRIASTNFQKLLFLYTREFEQQPSYDFVPYTYGCFSFTSYADKRRLTERGLLKDSDKKWELTKMGDKAARAASKVMDKAAYFHQRYKNLRGIRLIAEVYRRYPYFAIRSEILERVLLDENERSMVEQARPANGRPDLLTIGYESKSLELYLNQLLQAGVTVLCDVRRNPLSRKYGFSKSTLKAACERLAIRYEHLPALGIASERRQNLSEQLDYDNLFNDYMQNDLPKQTETLKRIIHWIKNEKQRVALTCFELQPHQCHRNCVADALTKMEGKELIPIHL